MAFLDNSGDIILDAVLTDLGRKRMAEGNFKITQFALGDDEIDYRIYNKNHPSGSAYYDLEILQTPVLEAFASANANINYGLVSFNGNLNLLYMPIMKVWGSDSHDVVDSGIQIARTSGSVFYVPANATTATAINTTFASHYSPAAAGKYSVGRPAGYNTGVFVECGISSSLGMPSRTKDGTNRGTYLVDKGLIDSNLDISMDIRFIGGFKAGRGSWEISDVGERKTKMEYTTEAVAGANRIGIANYGTAIIPTSESKIYQTEDTTASDHSLINGPSGYVSIFAPHLSGEHALDSSAAGYALYGKTGQDLFGDGNTYDYLDTIVYVVGKTTGVTAHIPFRIVRKVPTT
mgnify:FL=1